MTLSKKSFIFGILIGTVLLFSYLATLPDGKLHLVFCDVGQGDAAYIRTPSNADLLIDGGPDDKVLSCLGRHMPFYDRTIDVVVLSHPQKDHISGLIPVLQRYRVKYVISSVAGSQDKNYRDFIMAAGRKNIPVKRLNFSDSFSLGATKFSILWPEKEWIAQNSDDSDSSILGVSTGEDLNYFSYYINLRYGTFDALFTGDADSAIQPIIMELASLKDDLEILKIPHHGSRTAVLPEFLDKVKPKLAVISVGKNSYGHPAEETIKQLKDRAIGIKRTDREGDIEIVSDGKSWYVK